MKLFIVGQLGEVVKKAYELELSIKEMPNNTVLTTQYAAYRQVLDMWPVENEINAGLAVAVLRFNLKVLREAEEELRALAVTEKEENLSLVSRIYLNEYLEVLKGTRLALAKVNDLGRFIGDTPMLEIEDAEHPQDSSTA